MFRPCPQVAPLPNLTMIGARPLGACKQQFSAPVGRGDPRMGAGSGNRPQNAVSHEAVRLPITASCADGHDIGCTWRHFLENALLKRGPQSSRRIERDNGKGEPVSSPRFRAALTRWVVASSQRSRYWLLGPSLGTSLRATAGHLLPRLLPASL